MASRKQIVEVPGVFDSRPLGYAQCVTIGDLVFVAGQGGMDEQMQLVSAEFAPQAQQALLNVRRALEAAGARPEDITSVTLYLTDMGNLRSFAPIAREVLGEVWATSTAVAISSLALPGMLIEITVTAVRPEG